MTTFPAALLRLLLGVLLAGLAAADRAAAADEPDQNAVPSAEAIAETLQQEPISRQTWPTWRSRYLQWRYDRTNKTRKFDEQLQAFMLQEARANNHTLPAYLGDDAVAWNIYGWALTEEKKPASPLDNLARAEAAHRRSIELDPAFASPHGGLAAVLILQTMGLAAHEAKSDKQSCLEQAEEEIEKYVGLDSRSRPAFLRGLLADAREDFSEAENHFRRAMDDYPESEGAAVWFAMAVLRQERRDGKWCEVSEPLLQRFPEEGRLHALHAAALARDNEFSAAVEHLERARQLKTNPEETLGAESVKTIEHMAKVMTPAFRKGLEALKAERYFDAERCFRQALNEKPNESQYARFLTRAILGQGAPAHIDKVVAEIGGLCGQFPEDGELQAMYAVVLAVAKRPSEAAAALERAKQLGTDPENIIGRDSVEKIQEMSKPSLVGRLLWIMGYFAAAYAVIMLLMAGTGVLLAALTGGEPAPAPSPFVDTHELYRGESALATIYMLALLGSLILFYVAIPFVVVGLVGITGAILYGIFMLGRIPIKLVVIVVVIGVSMAWAVLKSIFAKGSGQSFGVRKTAADCPRFCEAVGEVAAKVGTDPVDELYLGPGAGISVHQQGRGPFGIFGVKRRVLSVGWATLRYLTIGELKAILAHEYAHFSHRDTFYSRFIYQVTLSIAHALGGMAAAGGRLNYVNPFYWFFVLYYRAYSLLAAGFSRSREFLADRIAASLYGKDVFFSALTKVATDGTLFEATAYQNVHHLLAEGKTFVNLYDAFASYRDDQLSDAERQKLYEDMLHQQGSLFSSHPTVRERLAAAASFPQAARAEEAPALDLFDRVEELEKELTEYLAGYFYAVRQWQAQAAAAED
jgi:Zn-dependent protease with chaperone function/TolA-binding protein